MDTGKTRFPLLCNLFELQCPRWGVSGLVSEGYEPVLEAFKKNFEEGLELGASFTAYGRTTIFKVVEN